MVPARWHDDRHIHRLGIGGRFDQAAALGFELGSLLTHQLHDVPRACAFWSAFRREHPHGRYDEELSSTVATLGCEK